MTRQPDLYAPMLATIRSRQLRLFDPDSGPGSGLSCDCGADLERTPSGYLVCPRGHGRLLEAVEPCGSWFDEDEYTEGQP